MLLGLALALVTIILRILGDWQRVTSSYVDRGGSTVHVKMPASAFVCALQSGPPRAAGWGAWPA
jgi:hypothetical protein